MTFKHSMPIHILCLCDRYKACDLIFLLTHCKAERQLMSRSVDDSSRMKLGSAIPRSRQQSSKTIITNLTPHLDSNLRKRALKHLKLSSQMPSALPQSTICEVYIVKKVFFDIASPVSPTTVSASSRPSSSTAISHTAVAKVDAVWVLIQNDEGCIVGSRLVSVKAMEEREVSFQSCRKHFARRDMFSTHLSSFRYLIDSGQSESFRGRGSKEGNGLGNGDSWGR